MSICFGSQRPYSSPLQPNQPDKSHNNMLMSTKAPVEDVLSYARLSHSRSHEENFNVRKSCDRH